MKRAKGRPSQISFFHAIWPNGIARRYRGPGRVASPRDTVNLLPAITPEKFFHSSINSDVISAEAIIPPPSAQAPGSSSWDITPSKETRLAARDLSSLLVEILRSCPLHLKYLG